MPARACADAAEFSISKLPGRCTMEQRYNVIITGTLAAGQTGQKVKENLIRMFRMPEAQAERLVGGEQYIVKKGVDLAAGELLRSALEKAGLVSRLDPPFQADSPPSPLPAQTAPAARPGGLFNVVFSGSIAPGLSVQAVKDALAEKCQMGATVIGRLFAGGPVIVSRELDHAGAVRMKDMLEKTGALCAILPVGQDISQAAAAASEAPAPSPAGATAPPTQTMYGVVRTTTAVEVTPRFFPLLLELLFCSPIVEIDGVAHEAKWWKKQYYPLTPGDHTVTIYFRYFRRPDCGRNSRSITVASGAPCSIEYFMWPWMYAAGSMSVSGGVDSPGVRPGRPASVYADLGRRIGAACIDLMIFGLFSGVFALMLAGTGVKSNQSEGMAAVAMQVLWWLYFALLEASPLQATVGKKLLKLKVTGDGGGRISFAKATLRHVARLFLLTLTLGLGFFMIAFSNRRQAIHDLATGTLVVST